MPVRIGAYIPYFCRSVYFCSCLQAKISSQTEGNYPFYLNSIFWKSVFLPTVFVVILIRIFPHSDWIRDNADQNNSEYGHFLCSDCYSYSFSEAYSESRRASKIFAEIINGWKPWTIFTKNSISDVWQGSE